MSGSSQGQIQLVLYGSNQCCSRSESRKSINMLAIWPPPGSHTYARIRENIPSCGGIRSTSTHPLHASTREYSPKHDRGSCLQSARSKLGQVKYPYFMEEVRMTATQSLMSQQRVSNPEQFREIQLAYASTRCATFMALDAPAKECPSENAT